jgi:hypothetical protein
MASRYGVAATKLCCGADSSCDGAGASLRSSTAAAVRHFVSRDGNNEVAAAFTHLSAVVKGPVSCRHHATHGAADRGAGSSAHGTA